LQSRAEVGIVRPLFMHVFSMAPGLEQDLEGVRGIDELLLFPSIDST
jgi:hypothetical protein